MLSDRSSSLSFASRTIGSAKEEINFEEMTDEQLRSTLGEAMRTSRTLTLENEVFERYLRRRDPQCLHKLSQVAESARQAQKIARLRVSHQVAGSRLGSTHSLSDRHRPSAVSLSQQLARTASGSQHLSIGPRQRGAKGLKITVAHRTELANKEVEDMRKQFAEFEKGMMRKKMSLETQLEEMKQRVTETKEAAEKFETEVLNGDNTTTTKIPMEKFVRFLEDQLKLAATIVDKLNLKIVTAKRLIRQTKKQIAQREELGKTIRPIDFDKLEIENKYVILENEKLNKTSTSLKQIIGHYNLMLKYHKDTLLERRSKLKAIQKELEEKKRENIELRRYQIRTTHEIEKVADQLGDIKRLQEKYEAPEVWDFLEVQRQLQEVKKQHKRLSRQRKIQLFTLRSRKKTN